MSVVYKDIDGEKVSAEWYALLTAARSAGVVFRVNEGHRTMARQQYFWDLYKSGRGNLAAYPSDNAPHIRTGRFDHAIDFNGAENIRRYAAAHGVTLTRTVRGEEWHLEANAAQLKAYANREPTIRRGSKNRPAITRIQKMLRGLHLSNVVNGKYGIWTRRAVRKFQRKHGLPVDGVVGPRTWKALRRASS